MAITPYKARESSFNRNRSSSCSSPIRNRIVYQEIFSVGSSTLVRSYSCDQVVDKDDKGHTFQTTQIQFSSFITPEKEVRTNYPESQVKKPRRLALEPPPEKPEMAKKKKSTESKQPENAPNATNTTKKVFFFILFTATSAWGLYYFLKYWECSYVWDLERTTDELMKSIFGQDLALLKINSGLKACNSSNDMYIMLFTGGVGVGKTFSSSIISHNFPWSSNKLIVHSEYFAEDINHLLKIEPSPCGCNLIIIDDLSVKTIKDTINLISSLSKVRKKNENFLIILIFQSHTEMERSEIVKEFKSAYINFDHVPFKLLTKDVVRKCFETEIQRQGVEIPEADLNKLVEERMRPMNITRGPTGCKGITEDVAVYLKKTN